VSATVMQRAVVEYVRCVRAELDDLSADEVEELTGGLEADLADALASEQQEDPRARFGAPADYAAELRAAAGLAPRAVPGGGRRGVRAAWSDGLAGLRRQPWWEPTSGYLVSLRPAWWLVRAAVVAVGITLVFGGGGAVGLLALVVLLVLSVPAGRRRWQDHGTSRRLVVAALNAAAVLVLVGGLLAALFTGGSSDGYSETAQYGYPSSGEFGDGLVNDGYPVVNVFPYDQDGEPLENVQLFDDRGRPLNPAGESYLDAQGRSVEYVPGVDENGRQRWNTYPLRERDPYLEGEVDPVTGEPVPVPTGAPHDAARPDATVAPLVPLPTPSPDKADRGSDDEN
jgi:hypothetical protein